MPQLEIFSDITKAKQTETCLTCVHRERHECGDSIIQYCGVRKSNRTENGLLKIKCKDAACPAYKKIEK